MSHMRLVIEGPNFTRNIWVNMVIHRYIWVYNAHVCVYLVPFIIYLYGTYQIGTCRPKVINNIANISSHLISFAPFIISYCSDAFQHGFHWLSKKFSLNWFHNERFDCVPVMTSCCYHQIIILSFLSEP